MLLLFSIMAGEEKSCSFVYRACLSKAFINFCVDFGFEGGIGD